MRIPSVQFKNETLPEIQFITKPLIQFHGYFVKLLTPFPSGANSLLEITKRTAAAAFAVFAYPLLVGLCLAGRIMYPNKSDLEEKNFIRRIDNELNYLIFNYNVPFRIIFKAKMKMNKMESIVFDRSCLTNTGNSDLFDFLKNRLRGSLLDTVRKNGLSPDYEVEIEMGVIEREPAENYVNVSRFRAVINEKESSGNGFPTKDVFRNDDLEGINDGLKLISNSSLCIG